MNKLILPQELQNDCKKIKTEEIADFEIKLDGLHHSVNIKDEPSDGDEDYSEELENGNTVLVIIQEEMEDHNDSSSNDVVFLEELEIENQGIIKEEMEDFEIKLKDLDHSVEDMDIKLEQLQDFQAQIRKQFECRVCNLKFPNELILQEHSKIHNSNRCSYQDSFSQFLKGQIEKKSFICEMCSYTTSRAELMGEHLRIHRTRFVPLDCDICGYKLTEESLELQLLSHKGKKQFMCKLSGIRCTRTANCRESLTVCDPAARPYACELCDYKGSTPTHLNRHLKIHIPGEQYRCKICHFQCNGLEFLRKHLLNHKS